MLGGLNITKLEEAIAKQKKLASIINNCEEVKQLGELVTKYIELGVDINLALADYKCESCGSLENLTTHHLVTRINKDFILLNKYIAQRHYFYDLAVLCVDCHSRLHNINPLMLICIPDERIKRVKEVFSDAL